MAKAKTKTARKKSVVLKDTAKLGAKEEIALHRTAVATLRSNLKGFKLDLRDAKVSARAANKDVIIALKVITQQEKAIEKAAARIIKLRAA